MSKNYYEQNSDYFNETSTEPQTPSKPIEDNSYDKYPTKSQSDEYGRVEAKRRIVGRVSQQD